MTTTVTRTYPGVNPTEEVVTADSIAAAVAQEVNTAGETQIAAIEAAGDTEIAAIEAAGDTEIAAVGAAGDSELSDIAAAGAAQVTAVQDVIPVGMYADTTAGLAAAASGEYFYAVNSTDSAVMADLYLDNAGTADYVDSLPNATEVRRNAVARKHAGKRMPPVLEWLRAKGYTFGFYDPNDDDTIFQDTAATTPAAEGDVVKALKAVGGQGPTLTQTAGATFGTREKDSNGLYYYDGVSTAFLVSSTTYSLTEHAYVGWAAARSVQDSYVMGGINADNANGMAVTNVASLGRWYINVKKTAETSVFIAENAGSLGYNVPGVISAYMDGATLRGMIDGGEHTPVTADFIAMHTGEVMANANYGLLKALTWPASASIASCRFGINNNGNGFAGTLAAQRFYGAVFVLATEPLPLWAQRDLHRWLRGLIRQIEVEDYDYDVFSVAGQSNAVGTSGTSGWTTSPTPAIGVGTEFTWQGALRPIRDPCEGDFAQYAASGSAWPSFAQAYYDDTGRNVCIVNNAYSGRGLITPSGREDAWTSDGQLVDRTAHKTKAAIKKIETLGRRAKHRGVIWMGGEQDATTAFTVSSYKAAIVDLRDRFRTAFGDSTLTLLIISLDDYAADSADYALLRQAQSEAASENDGIELIVSYQDYLGAGNHAVSPHLNQTALNDVGDRAGAACAALSSDEPLAE